MKRILHVLKYYRPTFTGEGVFLERCSAVMQEIAPDTRHDLLVTHTVRPADAAAIAACSTVSQVTYLSAWPISALRREIMLTWWFLRHLRHYDAIHFRTHADWYFGSYLLARLMGRRLVLSATLDDSLPVLAEQYRPMLRPLVSYAFRRLFNAFVSISPKLLQETLSAGADPAACYLVPCGITVPRLPPGTREQVRAELNVAPDAPVLLFVGGLCARKDPMFLVENLPAVLAGAPTARLVLIGPSLEPDYVAELTVLVRSSSLEDHVTFVGEQQDPHPWFAAADILTFASRLEGFGTVVPEAMGHGLPVVARRLPGVNDSFVLENETGYLFDTAAEYVAAVLQLAGDAVLRRRLGAAGQVLVQQRFGMRKIARQYLDIYGANTDGLEEAEGLGALSETETGLGYGASIVDQRFHTAIASPSDRPLLLTTVDAEEAFDWSKPFSRDAPDVSTIAQQYRAHRVFERHGVVPVYLVDYPVADQDAGRAPLRELLQGGLCEVGAQMHPWVTPPFLEDVNSHNSFAGNLPPVLELEKARRLTDILGKVFGQAPQIYRTGRFGVGPRTADILRSLSYLADSSVAPCWQPDRGGSRTNWSLSAWPYWVDKDRSLLEIPVTGAFVGRLAQQHGVRLAPAVFHPWSQQSGLTSAMARLGLLERIRLSPEGMSLGEAKRLVRAMLAAGHRTFVLTYHSPSLAPGNTPYVRTADDLARFLDWLDGFYDFFASEIGGRPASWREVRDAAVLRTVLSQREFSDP